MITVIKVGGNITDDDASLDQFLQQVARAEGPKLLVHGGGKSATELGKQLGISSRLIDGRRVTDAETLKLITMMYAGWINKHIVAKLQALGCNALGLCGADGQLVPSVQRSPVPVDYGFVGDPVENSVNVKLLHSLLEQGYCPVIAPVTLGKNGQLLNTNADTMASVLAAALSAEQRVQLIYCFEKNGVMNDPEEENSIVRELTPNTAEKLFDEGLIHSGMLPKLKAAFGAKERGVERVVIGHAFRLHELTKSDSTCTLLSMS
jgi:acetylglutamate kinase